MTRPSISRRVCFAVVLALSAAPVARSQQSDTPERRASLTVLVHESAS